MKIGVSLLNLRLGAMGGFETFARKVVDCLPKCAGDDDVVFIVNQHNGSFVPSSCMKHELDWSLRKTNAMRIREAVFPFLQNPLSRQLEVLGIDVMFYPHQAMFPVRNFMPAVVTVADIQHLYYPGYFSLKDRLFRQLSYKRALFRCDRIMAISNFTADCLVEKYGVDRDKISVVHHGFEPKDIGNIAPPAGCPGPYIYYPAASFPHKGHISLFRSFAALKRDGKIPHKLLLSGVRDEYWNELQRVIVDEAMEQSIVDYGFISYDEVSSLYFGADAIVFPTEYEGFGLPVLEAASMRKKLITSRLSVFDELGVPTEWQIDFSDPNQLLDAILREGKTELLVPPIDWDESMHRLHGLLVDAVEGRMNA